MTKPIRMKLDDDHYIDMDAPPPRIFALIARMKKQTDLGRAPDPSDLRALVRWVDQQERKYGSEHL